MNIKILFLIVVLASCRSPHSNVPSRDTDIIIADHDTYKIVEIEGCEYLASRGSYGYYSLAHKGNCKNEIHRCR